MNTQTPVKFLFPNLWNAINDESIKNFGEFVKGLDEETEVKNLTKSYGYYADLIPRSRNGYDWELGELKNYLIARKRKADEKKLSKKFERLQQISNAEDLQQIEITVEWKNSRMRGANPRASVRVKGHEYWHHYESSSIGGCGYDKESTAIAEAVNQSPEVLKALYLIRENNLSEKNSEVFGYGSGYGILPALEGGVGVSCYPRIFEKLGMNWQQVGNGKMFNVYLVSLK